MSKEAKRLRLSCEFMSPQCTECKVDVEDCFNKLPDEILVTILSLLILKEAAKTSILCRRWKSLWTFTTGSLDFDASKFLWLAPSETRKHLRYVKQPPESLKIVELRHFAGRVSDVEVAEFLVKWCVSLEKIIVDTREAEVKYYRSRMGSAEIDPKQVATECAKRLQRDIPTNAKWVII